MTRFRSISLSIAVALSLMLGASLRAEPRSGPEQEGDRKSDGSQDKKAGAERDKADRAKADRAKRGKQGRGEPDSQKREQPQTQGQPQRESPPATPQQRGTAAPEARDDNRRGQPSAAPQGARLPPERQKQMVAQQQERLTRYRQESQRQEQARRQRPVLLQQQHRASQARLHTQYLGRRTQILIRLGNRPGYDRDPFFYTPPIYRYARANRYYEVNRSGADVLRQAVNYGYDEGYRAGVADREDRWPSNYSDNYIYQDGDYGYDGYYVDLDDYVFYFREGFRRGYEDGYGGHYRYGRYDNGTYRLHDETMVQILIFIPLR